MNRAWTIEELRLRGYPENLITLAVDAAVLTGEYSLARHRVVMPGGGEFQITPLPWTDDGRDTEPVPLPDSFRGRDVPAILEIIEAVDAWLDGTVAETYRDQPLAQDWARTAKVGEELGEAQEELEEWRAAAAQARVAAIAGPAGRAVSALIAVTGQNPRKGVHGTQAALTAELADVVCTGLFAIQHFTKDASITWEIVTESLAKAMSRVPGTSPFPPESGMTRQDAIDNGIIDE